MLADAHVTSRCLAGMVPAGAGRIQTRPGQGEVASTRSRRGVSRSRSRSAEVQRRRETVTVIVQFVGVEVVTGGVVAWLLPSAVGGSGVALGCDCSGGCVGCGGAA